MDTAIPLAYLLTFTCYGTSLHGVNLAGDSACYFLTHQLSRSRPRPKEKLNEPAYFLDELRRFIALRAIEETCEFYGWTLYAAHVRTHHIHLVLAAQEPAEKLMSLIQMNASRRLRESKLDGMRGNRWNKAGCTKYLWKPRQVHAAIRFVVEEQGFPMAVCENPIQVYEQGGSDAS